ncbi:U4 snRNA binding protein [Aureococcus anophagefferens]|nr:U4 snRNA binding protein [Aureococcus anophagefferens]
MGSGKSKNAEGSISLKLTLEGHTARIHSCSFSADGALVVTGGDDKTVKLWNTGNGKLVRDIEEASYVTACKVSNKGDVIASSSTDNTCKLWDAFSGELLKTLDGHESFCLSCNFSPDGKRLMTTSDDQTAILWDVATRAGKG